MSKEIDAYVLMDNLLIVFRFVYLSSNKSISFQYWGTSNQPNNLKGGQNCVDIPPTRATLTLPWLGPPGSWNDEQCTQTFYFICEKIE